MATFSKNRVFGKLINQYEINGVSYTANTTGSITVGESGSSSIAAAAGTSVYATPNDLPVSGNSEGDQAFVSSNNRLYIWNGSGWYNIALINTNPSISSILDSDSASGPFVLSTEGIPITITITASDPEGLPITYTAVTDSAFDGIATLAQDSSIFTVTPLSQDSAVPGSGNVTFRVSDGVNIASSIQSFTLNFVNALWKDVVLSIGTNSTNGIANQTYVDKSANAIALSIAGTPTQTAFHPYLENWSVEFDGTDDRLETSGTSSDFAYGTGDFTIECWAYSTEGNRYANIVQQRGTGGPLLRIENNNKLQYFRGEGVNVQIGTTTILTNQWYHFALSRNNNTIKIYINGVEELSFSETYDFSTNGAVQVASFNNVEYFKGYISNIRIVKGTALYTSNFTPPTEKLTAVTGTSLLTCQSNRFIDNSMNAHTITVTSNPKVSSYNPFGQESEYASGQNKGSVQIDTGEMVSGTGIADMAVGTGAFTYEAWVYTPNFSYDNGGGIIYSQVQNGQNYLMLIINTSGQPAITYGDGGGTGITGSIAIKLNSWNHVAWVRENTGTDGFKIYLNGEVAATGTVAYNFSSTSMGFAFGRYPHTALVQYNGYISDFKYTKSAVYTAAFTPPTAPLGNTNATMYVPFDNAGIYDKTGNNLLTLVGNTATSTAQTKYATTSIYLAAGANYFVKPETKFIINSDATIEFWLYIATAASGYSTLLAQGYSGGSPRGWTLFTSGANLLFYATTGAGSWDILSGYDTGIDQTTGVWRHIAIVRNGDNLTFYVNGTSTATTTALAGSTVGLGDTDLYIASNIGPTQYHFGGDIYIENFQILEGVAKYTGNFTPPTLTQGRTYQAES